MQSLGLDVKPGHRAGGVAAAGEDGGDFSLDDLTV